MTSSDILYILRPFIIQHCGIISYAFLLSINAIGRCCSLRICWSMYSCSPVSLVRLQQHLWGRRWPACGKLVPKWAMLPELVGWEQSPLHIARCYPVLHYGKGGRRSQILALWWFYARYQHHTFAGSWQWGTAGFRNRHLLYLHQAVQ